jgi:hypothetical protein
MNSCFSAVSAYTSVGEIAWRATFLLMRPQMKRLVPTFLSLVLFHCDRYFESFIN